MQINENVLKLKESATLAINLKARGLREKGQSVYHWGFGQSPFPVPKAIQEELRARTSHKEYLPTLGLKKLRETLVEFFQSQYKLSFSSEHIFIGPGSKELIFQLLYLLDHPVIIPAPSWVSYGPQVTLKGENWHTIKTNIDNQYKLTASELDKFLSQNKSKREFVLILNSPNNPTGQIFNEDELKALANVCRKYGVIVISDEIYGQVNFSKDTTPSLASFYKEGTIVTGGLSKAFSAGGYRLGYMCIPTELEEIIPPFKSMISETFSAVAAPIQYAAIKAYDGTKSVLAEVQTCNKIHREVATYFHERLTHMGLKVPAAQGAFYMFVSFEHLAEKLRAKNINSGKHLCDYLLEHHHIALLPGEDFYFDEYSVRLAFVDYDGRAVIEAAQNQEVDRDFVLSNIPQSKAGLDELEKFIKDLN